MRESKKKNLCVEVEIGSAKRAVKLNVNAIAVLEQMHGKSVLEIFGERTLSVRVVRDALYAGLRAGEEDEDEAKRMTPELVGDWMSEEPARFAEWGQAVNLALLTGLGKAEQAEKLQAETVQPIEAPKEGSHGGE